MKHFGDITKIDGHEVPLADIVTGGSPCQDLSVAGKRAGLAGERSGLFMEQIRVIKEMRDESAKQLSSRGTAFDIRYIQPRYMVWENVPGAFSSNKGEDFRAVLEETAKVICENAVIPRPEGGAVESFWLHHGKWVEHCLASTRCTVLGSTPEKKTYRACRRFWRRHRTRNIV
jgi:DNA (cytosine-5)-methyltransferase 1